MNTSIHIEGWCQYGETLEPISELQTLSQLLLSSYSKLIEAELWAYGHVWKSDVFNYVTMWEGPDYTGARPLGSMRRFGP